MREDKTYFEYANEAATKTRKISQLLCGTEVPEEGSLLEGIDYCIFSMIQLHLAPIVGKEPHSDEMNYKAMEIMYADESEVNGIVKSGGMEYGLVLHDVNNVLEQLHNAGGCDGSTEYARGWDDAMEEAERIVAAGLSLKANAGWNEPD